MDRTTAISRHRRFLLRHFCSSHFSYIGYILLYCGKILHNGNSPFLLFSYTHFSGIHTRTLWCSHPAIHLQNFLLPHTEILYPLHNNHPFTFPFPSPRTTALLSISVTNHTVSFILMKVGHSQALHLPKVQRERKTMPAREHRQVATQMLSKGESLGGQTT